MKELPNYPGYCITETGEVYSNKSGKYLKQTYTRRGYKQVSLYCGGRNFPRVHKLVAEAFIPNPLNLPSIDHIDNDKTNNNVSNLQWITHQGNAEKAHAKHYIVEHIASGETFEVYNLEKWCRGRKLTATALRSTGREGSKDKSHKGFRLTKRL